MQSGHWYPYYHGVRSCKPHHGSSCKNIPENQLASSFFPTCHSSNIEFLARCEGHGILTAFVRDLRGHFLWGWCRMLEKDDRCEWEVSSKKQGVPPNWKVFDTRNGCDVHFGCFLLLILKNKYPQEIKVYVEIESYTNHLRIIQCQCL